MSRKCCLIVFYDCCVFPLFSFPSVCCNHPCCGAPDIPPLPPSSHLGEGGCAGVVLRLQPGRRVSGVCYFCRPIVSTRVAQGWLFIVLPRRVAGRGRGAAWVVHALSPWRLCVDSISQPSFRKCQKSHLGGLVGGWMGYWFPQCASVSI